MKLKDFAKFTLWHMSFEVKLDQIDSMCPVGTDVHKNSVIIILFSIVHLDYSTARS